jgi:hypothetical protein
MRRVLICGLALAFAGSVACGKSEAEKQLEEASKQAEAAAKQMEAAAKEMEKAAEDAGGDMQKASEGFGKAMAGFASAMAGGDGKSVEPVSFRELQVALPSVAGWTMDGKAKGEKMTSPVPFSQTEARYTKGEASMDVKVVDSGFSQMLVAPWAMFLTTGYEKETDEGYEKSTKVAGHPGFERWNSEDKSGELNFVVGKRFLVTVEGRDLADAKDLHAFAEKMDLAKLASLDTSSAGK